MIVRKGKGTVVAPRAQWDLLDPSTLSAGLRHGVPEIAQHVLEARRLLEPMVVGLAAERATGAQRAGLEQLMRRLRQPVEDFVAHLDVGLQFHRALAEASNNPLLARMLASIYTALGMWHGARALPASLRQTNHDDHERILAAVLARDQEAASAAAAAHLATVFDIVVRTAVERGRAGGTTAMTVTDRESAAELLALRR
jgi:DNA-binding FadR family transcriptional regulator